MASRNLKASHLTCFEFNSSSRILLRLCNLENALILSWSSLVTSASVASDSSSFESWISPMRMSAVKIDVEKKRR